MNKSFVRRLMIEELKDQALKKIYKARSTTVEPMQALVKSRTLLDEGKH